MAEARDPGTSNSSSTEPELPVGHEQPAPASSAAGMADEAAAPLGATEQGQVTADTDGVSQDDPERGPADTDGVPADGPEQGLADPAPGNPVSPVADGPAADSTEAPDATVAPAAAEAPAAFTAAPVAADAAAALGAIPAPDAAPQPEQAAAAATKPAKPVRRTRKTAAGTRASAAGAAATGAAAAGAAAAATDQAEASAAPARKPRKRAAARSTAATATATTARAPRASTARTAKPRVVPPKPRIPRAGKTVLDGLGVPVFGARQGAVASVDWSGLSDDFRRGSLLSFLRRKRWVYVTAATEEVLVALAVVDAGSSGTGFCMITDLKSGETIATSSRPGGGRPLVGVSDEPLDGLLATYRLPGTEYRISRDPGSNETRVSVRLRRSGESMPGLRWLPGISSIPVLRDLPTASSNPWLEIDLTLESSVAPPLTAVSRVEADGGLVTSTVKTAAMNAWGTITLHGDDPAQAPHTFSLDGGTGGMDYSNGFLPRHTAWRWAYTTGRLDDGRLFGLNLVSEFSGIGDESCENGVWLDGALVPLDPRVRVLFDRRDLAKPWTVRTVDGSVHLQFKPLAVHRHGLNVGVVRSAFVQPTGRFYGHVMVEGERVVVNGLPGVVENQDILW